MVRGEQIVAPADGSFETAQALGLVCRSLGQELEAVIEPGQDRLRGEGACLAGRQLDGERKPIELAADFGNGFEAGGIEREGWVGSAGALGKELHRG